MKSMRQGLLRKWIPPFLLGAALIILYKTVDNLSGVMGFFSTLTALLRPFVIGGIVAFLLYLPCSKLENFLGGRKLNLLKKRAHIIAVSTTVICFLVILFSVTWLFIPFIYTSVVSFIKQIPSLVDSADKTFDSLVESNNWLVGFANIDFEAIKRALSVNNLIGWLGMDNVQLYTKGLQNVLSTILDVLLGLVIAVYILSDAERLGVGFKNTLTTFLPIKRVNGIFRISGRIGKTVYSFLYGQSLDALFVGSCCAIGFNVMFIPNATELAFIFGVSSLVPYFGAFIGTFICAVFTLISAGWVKALIALAFILVLQQIDGNIVNPRIIGNSLGIRPLAVIFGITVGGGFFGLAGMLLGAPCMAIFTQLFQEYSLQRRQRLDADQPEEKPDERQTYNE